MASVRARLRGSGSGMLLTNLHPNPNPNPNPNRNPNRNPNPNPKQGMLLIEPPPGLLDIVQPKRKERVTIRALIPARRPGRPSSANVWQTSVDAPAGPARLMSAGFPWTLAGPAR